MAPARSRLNPAMLLLPLLGALCAAALIHSPPAIAVPLIPDSASGAGSEDDTWPEAGLPPAVVTPTPVPLPAPPRPERPAVVPREVAVGDLALGHEPPAPGDAVSKPLQPLHYPLAVGALEQDPWGWRFSSARGAWRMHTGVDLIAPEGTAVLAVHTGRVQRVADIAGYGLTVLVDHGGGWSSLYAHLLEASVIPGDSVRAGQPLGLVGQSGNASGPHLHLEVRQRQPQGLVAVDPTPLLPAPPPGGAIAGDIRP
ncbi:MULTISPECIES: M23 family metallopeptidase [unclassified Synechococcus]|uniref:M23 family metallopeptidase n=1 Tax=unclassified Synechococcus TaxID=2626047 RepID=UPI0020CB9625|nr:MULTISPECIES: M23 family metallopeptidase [unclassified Synechococcus]